MAKNETTKKVKTNSVAMSWAYWRSHYASEGVKILDDDSGHSPATFLSPRQARLAISKCTTQTAIDGPGERYMEETKHLLNDNVAKAVTSAEREKEARGKARCYTDGQETALSSSQKKGSTSSVPMFRGVEPSMWDFWKHGVTSSFIGSYLSCREQTRLAFVQGWTSKTLSLAIEFGSCMHWIFEQAYAEEAGFMKAKKVPTTEWCKSTVKLYEKKWLAETKDPTSKQLEQQEMVYGLAEQVAPVYFRRWDGDFTGNYTQGNNTVRPARWISLEEIFEVPYTYPDGKVVPLRGRRDGVFADKREDTYVLDTKCRSVISEQDTTDTMEHDLQQMFYLYVTMEQIKLGLIEGVKKPPVGMVLNVVRRPGHRRLQTEALKTFFERVGRDIALPKNKDYQFPRFQLQITADEIRTWKKKILDPIMAEIRMWWEGSIPHYMNPNSLLSKYGRCALFLPLTKDEYGMCFKRKKVFNELPEVAT